MVAAERKKISQNMDGKLTYEDARPIGSYCGFALELKRSLMDEVRICIHGDTSAWWSWVTAQPAVFSALTTL